MKVIVYPADTYGCGYHRMIWPAQELQKQGYNVEIIMPHSRELRVKLDRHDCVVDVTLPDDVDVLVFQRMTHKVIVQVIRWCTERGIAVVIDVDDDLSAIHPANPAASAMNLTYSRGGKPDRRKPHTQTVHSWMHLSEASRYATVMQVSTPGLIPVYGRHRPTRVVRNYLSDIYYDKHRIYTDSADIGWPASLHSHPNDPAVMGATMRQLMDDGTHFTVISDPQNVQQAFGLKHSPECIPGVELSDWPQTIAQLGIGIVPLAGSKFNRSKSWLKGLELSAVGVPWVASPRAEYRALHALGCGALAVSPGDWLTSLTALRASASMRAEFSEAGCSVAKTLRLSDHAWRFWEVWDEARQIAQHSKAE